MSSSNRFANVRLSAGQRQAAERQWRIAEFVVDGVAGAAADVQAFVVQALRAAGLRRAVHRAARRA